MLEELLVRDEGKTLEFKENTLSLPKIIQTSNSFCESSRMYLFREVGQTRSVFIV